MDIEKKLIDAFFISHPAEAVQVLNNLDGKALGELLDALDPRSVATSLQKAQSKIAAVALGNMQINSAARILQELPFSTQLVLILSLDAKKREMLLDALPDSHSRKLHLMLDYPKGCAGYLMDPAPVSVLPDCLVKNALEQIRAEADYAGYYIYVNDNKGRPIGVVTLQEILKAEPQASVESIMSTEIASIPARASERDIIKHPHWRDFHELPVVNRNQVLIGVIRYETMNRLKSRRSSDYSDQDPLAGLLALSELYWLGMTGFLDTISISTEDSSRSSDITGEVNDE